MKRSRLRSAAPALAIALLLGGCSKEENPVSSDYFSDEASTTQSENSSSSSESVESSSTSSVRELSADDQALRLILSEILEGAQEVDRLFRGGLATDGAKYHGLLANGEVSRNEFYEITENARTQPNGLFPAPRTRDEIEQLLRRYFTDRTIKYYMDLIHSGKFSTDSDGNTVVTDDNDDFFSFASLLEIDGKLYGRSGYDTYRTLSNIKLDDTIVTERTDTSIKFIYREHDGKYTDGVLLYENGSWKFDFFGWFGFIPEMPDPATYTDDDKELQAILDELEPGRTICEWRFFGARTPDRFDFHIQPGGYDETYFLLPLEEATSAGDIYYPQTIDELEQLLLKYFTRNMVDNSFMSNACKGIMTENPDGTYTVTLDPECGKYIKYPMFLEIDGRMYSLYSMRDLMPDVIWNTAQIIEKTDSFIRFKYIESALGEYYEEEGLIKYERGGWRLNMDDRGDFETNV